MRMESLKDCCDRLRLELETMKQSVITLKSCNANAKYETANRSEVLANIMLVYRHLEDARMRLGKVLQANDSGISIYDKKD